MFTALHSIQETHLAHDEYFENLFSKEYFRLDEGGHTYLDYTGGGLFAHSQLQLHFDLLSQHTLGNPHSINPTSHLSTVFADYTRKTVIEFFKAYDYTCIFTANASQALKIIGESYPYSPQTRLVLTADNHNSVNGLRVFAQHKKAETSYIPLNQDMSLDENAMIETLQSPKTYAHKLLAFPAQSNASGIRHNLDWIQKAKNFGWDVLLDAAAFVPTSKLDLSIYKPDFVALSFYKMFGYPTGVGCLLVRNASFHKLSKPWFAGGTVKMASVKKDMYSLQENHEKFEDGTINYLALPAVKTGLDYLTSIGMDRISQRVDSLQKYAVSKLKEIRHASGKPVLQIYGPISRSNMGGTITMNVFDPLGRKIPYEDVEKKAANHHISLRAGCFCNPGVDETANKLELYQIVSSSKIHGERGDQPLQENINNYRGAVRISVGLATRKKELDVFIQFIETFRDKM